MKMRIAKTIALLAVVVGVSLYYTSLKADILDIEIKDKLKEILQTEQGVQQAEVKIEIAPKPMGNTHVIDFSEFDVNQDGVFTREEVGERLFKVFDRDRNGVIDNREMKRASLKVRGVMQKKVIETIDYRNPNKEQKVSMTMEEFLSDSQLAEFDKNKDGLSPLEFLGKDFIQVNVNNKENDNVIDLYEWKRAYADKIRPRHEEWFNYNQ